MAVHKVPQDVEAEDKFLGPLSFKQFLFFGGAMVSGFIMYQLATSPLPFLAFIMLPFLVVCITLAFPWTRDQPTELWLASRIRFMIIPRKRIWDQDDVKELVTITAPKRDVHVYTDGLSQAQIQSRLSALANVLDSKGWAVKNASASAQLRTDRLVSDSSISQGPLKQLDLADPLDENVSGVAQNLNAMIQQAEERRKQQARQMMTQAVQQSVPPPPPTQAAPAGQPAVSGEPWFLQSSQFNSSTPAAMQASSSPTSDEQALLDRIHKQREDQQKIGRSDRLKVIQPLSQQAQSAPAPQPQAIVPDTPPTPPASTNPTQPEPSLPPPPPMTDLSAYATSPPAIDPAIMSLAQNDDLNVETLARQANRVINMGEDDEIIISLHDNE